MRNLLKIWLPVILIILFVHYCYYSTFSSPFRLTSLASVSFILPPSEYEVVEMDDRIPSFKLATINGRKPYADGDRAQATVVDSLQLVNKCKQDRSLIVVDVGAYLGSHTLYLKKREIIK